MLLNKEQLQIELKKIPSWKFATNGIENKFQFKNFNEAITFINSIAIEAETMNHHPEWCNIYNKVSIRLTTHDLGGVSNKDIELATAIDAIKFST